VKFVKGDGRLFGTQEPASFDRVGSNFSKIIYLLFIIQVLVDVPCTSDRHALMTAFNIFSKKRIQERVELPVYQQKLLEYIRSDLKKFSIEHFLLF
jgi:hypothetical protein